VRYVLDSNVALKCFLPEELSDVARRVLERSASGALTLIAPEILLAEVAHALRREVVRKRLPADEALTIWKDIRAMQIEMHSIAELADEAFTLALDNMGAAYDALYIALAEREDVQVLTADDRMTNAFASLKRTVPLASFK
jgi:predicted nucleic acid-binding protein